MNYSLSEIYIYPIKSLGGISLDESEVTDRGLQYDRRWMLIDEKNNFLTQRTHPQMALLKVEIECDELVVSHKQDSQKIIRIPLENFFFTKELFQVSVWNDKVHVKSYNDQINEWFSEQLGIRCKLVYMPESAQRKVDPAFAKKGEVTSLSDGYPFLIIGQESLNLLNSKLAEPIPMNRFRPNFVFTGGIPHEEDEWNEFTIGDIVFQGVKKCSRCVVTTIDQQTSSVSKEPLKTLSTYRNFNNKIMFGMNLLHSGKGEVKVGNTVIVSYQ